MRKIIVIAFVLFSLASLAAAQIPTSGNAFFGYSFYNADLSSIGRTNTNGWEASVEGKMLPFIGIVADFDAHYGSQNFPAACPVVIPNCNATINLNVTGHNYLFGPRVSVSVGKIRPFGEAMFGGAHVTAAGSSDISFASALGGGIDYRLIRLVAWRLQGDYVHTHLFGFGQNNVRISTGIVVRF